MLLNCLLLFLHINHMKFEWTHLFFRWGSGYWEIVETITQIIIIFRNQVRSSQHHRFSDILWRALTDQHRAEKSNYGTRLVFLFLSWIKYISSNNFVTHSTHLVPHDEASYTCISTYFLHQHPICSPKLICSSLVFKKPPSRTRLLRMKNHWGINAFCS